MKTITFHMPEVWTREKFLELLRIFSEGHGPEAFTLKYGSFYAPEVIDSKYGHYRALNGMCFHNAAIFAQLTGLAYVEGVAVVNGGIPHAHAWNARPGSKNVIDLTWANSGAIYHGVEFDTRFAVLNVLARGSVIAISDDHEPAPVLSGEYPERLWRAKV